MTDHSPASPDGIPAATIVIFRNSTSGKPPELLMVTRSRAMSFAAGAAVFPGGRVDDADFALARDLHTDLPLDETAHRVAAIRETLEETGLAVGLTGAIDAATASRARALLLEQGALAPVLDAMQWQIDVHAIVPFSRWYPKNERLPRVFDTRFYLVDLGTGAVDIAVDETENTHLFWISACDAIAAADAGDLTIIYPTRRNLERLALFASFNDALNHCATYGAKLITPWLEERDGEKWLMIRDDAGYPVLGEKLTAAMRGD